MSIRIQVPRSSLVGRFFAARWAKWLLISLAAIFVTVLSVTGYYYSKYARAIEEKLAIGPFAKTSKLYGAPETIRVGDAMGSQEIAVELRKAGYAEAKNSNLVGWYNFRGDAIEIFPGLILISGRTRSSSASPAENFRRSRPFVTARAAPNISLSRS